MIADIGRSHITPSASLPTPFWAFEFNETSGLTLTEEITGTEFVTIDGTNITLLDIGGGRRGIDFTNETHNGTTSTSGATPLPITGSNRTLEVYYYQKTNTDSYPIMLKIKSGTANMPFLVMLSGSSQYYGVFAGHATRTIQYSRICAANLPQNQWVHLVVTLADTGYVQEIYLNAVPSSTQVGPNTSGGTDQTVFGDWGGSSYQFKGYMDFVRVYDSILSTADITALYNARNG